MKNLFVSVFVYVKKLRDLSFIYMVKRDGICEVN